MGSLWFIVSYMWVWKELSVEHYNRVLTDHWKPEKFWNFIVHFPGLKSHGFWSSGHGKSWKVTEN